MRGRYASRLRWVLVLASVLLWSNEPASAQPAVQRGYIFVRAHCSQCHAIDRSGATPLATATSFRTLRLRYPVADLQRRSRPGGVHVLLPTCPAIAPDALRSLYPDWKQEEIKRRKRGTLAKNAPGLILSKPCPGDTA